jgi:hypothetical protein
MDTLDVSILIYDADTPWVSMYSYSIATAIDGVQFNPINFIIGSARANWKDGSLIPHHKDS